tara:strand:- start:38 stop:883 length:846 start_codon:yes stop_codon:yes gene_type:complete
MAYADKLKQSLQSTNNKLSKAALNIDRPDQDISANSVNDLNINFGKMMGPKPLANTKRGNEGSDKGADKQYKIDFFHKMLGVGIEDTRVLAQAALESGYGKFKSGKNNYFGVKSNDITKGSLHMTSEMRSAYGNNAAGDLRMKNEVETRGGTYYGTFIDKEGRTRYKIKDRFRDYATEKEAIKDYKYQKRKILADPDKHYSTLDNYSDLIKQFENETRYYLSRSDLNFTFYDGKPLVDSKDNANASADRDNPDFDPVMDLVNIKSPFEPDEIDIKLTEKRR